MNTLIIYSYYVKLKLFHLVEFKTVQITYRARNNLPPGNCWKMFFEREVGYNLREKMILKTLCSCNECGVQAMPKHDTGVFFYYYKVIFK